MQGDAVDYTQPEEFVVRTTLLMLLPVLVSACAGSGQRSSELLSPATPPGSYFTLHTALEIPREDTTVYIQYGQPVAPHEVEEWAPHCFFELYTRAEEPRLVKPDEFEIQRVVRESSPLWVGLPVTVAFGGGEDSGPTHLYYRTRYYLNSPNQPDVWRMNCQIDRMEAHGLSFDSWLTVAQVQEALTGLFSLTLPGGTRPQPD